MTLYNTKNPVGSADPRDLYDNSIVIDEFSNSSSETATDRLGQSRKTIRGLVVSAQNATGYVFKGDYEADIELTAYNEVVRDSNGEFWRVSGTTALPYTTDGSGLPEGGAFVAVGDASLRQALADASQGGELVEVTTDTGAQTLAAALNERATSAELDTLRADALRDADLTVNIPGDYATLQEAVDALSMLSVGQGVTIDLVIESGHQPASGVFVTNGDYRHFQISSVDAEVTLAGSYAFDYFLKAERAAAPVFNIILDCDGQANRPIDIQDGSNLWMTPFSGVRNPAGDCVYLNNGSSGVVSGAELTGAVNGRSLWVARNSDCLANNCTFEGGVDYNVWVTRASNAYGESCSFSGSGIAGIGATRYSSAAFNLATMTNSNAAVNCISASVLINDSTCTGLKQYALSAVENGHITARNGIFRADSGSGSLEHGVLAEYGGSISIRDAEVTGFPLSCLRCYSGSNITATGVDINGTGTAAGSGINCRDGSTVTAAGATINSVAVGVDCRGAGVVVVNAGASILNVGDHAIQCATGGRVDVSFATASGSGNEDISIISGSTVIANGATTTGGSVNPGDTNIAAFNEVTSNGIIFA